MLMNVLENKLKILASTALILVPCYTWKRLYNSYKYFKNKYNEELLFYKRHNCVVMYSALEGMSGWPPSTGRIKLNFNKESCMAELREPILYFISTAQKSLDIAYMLISVQGIYKALVEAHQKGIKVRLILNFEHCEGKLNEIRNLMKEGVEVLTYVSQGIASIMHYKYIIKDYTHYSGFVVTGSLNLTDSGFINNYEDVVFTSNPCIAKAFHEDFEESWNLVKISNEDLINKTTLLDANLA